MAIFKTVPKKPAVPIGPQSVAPLMSIAPKAAPKMSTQNMSVARPIVPVSGSNFSLLGKAPLSTSPMTSTSRLASLTTPTSTIGVAPVVQRSTPAPRQIAGPMTPAPKMSVAPKPVVPAPLPQVALPMRTAMPNITTPSGLTVNPNTGGVAAAQQNPPPAPTGLPPVPSVPPTTAAVAPTPAAVQNPEVMAALKAYQDAQMMSPEEEAVLGDLSKLDESYRKGYANTADQTIPLEFITGQQNSIERRMLNLQQPLKDRAALLQAKRLAALDAAKFSLDRADKEASTRREENAPIKVGDSIVRLNPATGKYETVYSSPTAAEPVTLGEGQRLVNPTTGEIIAEGAIKEEAAPSSFREWELAGSPGTYSDWVSGATKKQGEVREKNTAALEQANAALEAVTALETMKGLSGAVGAKGPSSLFGIFDNPIAGTNAAGFKAQLDRVKSLLTLPALQQLKGLGAMSDREFATLSASVGALDRNMSESQFKSELARIKQVLSDSVTKLGSSDSAALDNALDQAGLKGDLNKSLNGSNIQRLKASIIRQESGGNYAAVGLDTPHGKALGKYQIIPKFHFSKIGLKNTPEDRKKFLNSPALQDALFGLIIDELDRRYKGNGLKIAAAYYGGSAAAKVVGTSAGSRKQTAGGKTMPSINEYAYNVNRRV